MNNTRREIRLARVLIPILIVLLCSTSAWAYTVNYTYDTGGQLTNALYSNKANISYAFDSRYNATSANTDTFPTINITNPADGSNQINSVTVTGTASDDGTVASVQLSFDGGVSWVTPTGTASWAYLWTPASSGTYQIQAKATDDAGYSTTSTIAVNVIVDHIPPSSGIVTPATGTVINGTSYAITGTASDNSGGSGVQKVEISTNGGVSWNTATGTTSWSYNWTLPADGSYTILSRATDTAGNVETPGTGITVTVDNTAPSSSITAPANNSSLSGLTYTITGTATDGTGSGVAKVDISTNGGVSWNTATGTTSWSYAWSISSAGSYNIQARATDNAGNVQITPSTVSVTAKSNLFINRSGINLNYNLARPAPMTKFKVSSQPWNISGNAASSNSWLKVSQTASATPADILLNINTAGLAAGTYSGFVSFSSVDAASNLSVPVSLTVVPASAASPENQHYDWDLSLTGGNCDICHLTAGTFLPSDFDKQNSKEFCLSCHNSTSVAHEKSHLGKVHPIFVNASAGGGRWPIYGNVTAAEKNNEPFSRLKNNRLTVCATCHNSMGKYEDYGRVWELTTTGDRYTYYLSDGGWSNYGPLAPVVYRTTSVMSAPTYSKSREAYVVDPSEYAYDEVAGSITFNTQQTANAVIYVTLDYPYLRASSEQNRLCSDCHAQLTHQSINCLICHSAHNANTNNIREIRGKIRSPDLVERSVIFLQYTGMNSFADGDTTYDGVCEVCHTTTKYYRYDGTGFANHSGGFKYDRTNCTECHKHSNGFSKYSTSQSGLVTQPSQPSGSGGSSPYLLQSPSTPSAPRSLGTYSLI